MKQGTLNNKETNNLIKNWVKDVFKSISDIASKMTYKCQQAYEKILSITPN